ncbi:hypothetical protein PDJAM_G00247840 [Pangasius djambal]|uniref:Uncharacterized protein n=1 Tax=Pangasius djambal TaxID=1691987 RepID=A0ACC5YIR0_9TELE|nr:hypothetical protein [Pangasius djambal]
MEDEERRRKLEAGKAKLAEYRQRKAQSDGQKKKKKKKNKGSEQQEGEQENYAIFDFGTFDRCSEKIDVFVFC